MQRRWYFICLNTCTCTRLQVLPGSHFVMRDPRDWFSTQLFWLTSTKSSGDILLIASYMNQTSSPRRGLIKQLIVEYSLTKYSRLCLPREMFGFSDSESEIVPVPALLMWWSQALQTGVESLSRAAGLKPPNL